MFIRRLLVATAARLEKIESEHSASQQGLGGREKDFLGIYWGIEDFEASITSDRNSE